MAYAGGWKSGHAPENLAREMHYANEVETEWRLFSRHSGVTLGYEHKMYRPELSSLPSDKNGYCHFMICGEEK
jgi:hypothetical protein